MSEEELAKAQKRSLKRWTIKSYKRDAIPNTGWMVAHGSKVIMRELTKQAALQLAADHNECFRCESQSPAK